MKKFTIEVSHASPAQLSTIGLELKIMANAWEKFGPRITINGKKLEAPSLTIPGSSHKPQASSFKLDKRQALGYYRRHASKRRQKNNRINDSDQEDAWPELLTTCLGV